jgi:hypothetical protein
MTLGRICGAEAESAILADFLHSSHLALSVGDKSIIGVVHCRLH